MLAGVFLLGGVASLAGALSGNSSHTAQASTAAPQSCHYASPALTLAREQEIAASQELPASREAEEADGPRRAQGTEAAQEPRPFRPVVAQGKEEEPARYNWSLDFIPRGKKFLEEECEEANEELKRFLKRLRREARLLYLEWSEDGAQARSLAIRRMLGEAEQAEPPTSTSGTSGTSWYPGHRLFILPPSTPFEIFEGPYRAWSPRRRAVATTPQPDTEEKTEEQETEEEDDKGEENPPKVKAVATSTTPALRTAARLMLRSTAVATTSLEDEEDKTLTWQGSATSSSAAWDESSSYWTQGSATTTFSANDAVRFDATGLSRDITLASNRTVASMSVTGTGYNFSGNGDIIITGALTVTMPEGTTDALNTLTFGENNGIDADSITLNSGINSLTTFNGTVKANSLTITNCAEHQHAAGIYQFQQGFLVAGAASITLDTDTATEDEMLTVSGDAQAGSLTLSGSATKIFRDNVTTQGDLRIQGISTQLSGSTYFEGAVTVGGSLIIEDNSEAFFRDGLSTASAASTLSIILNNGSLRYETYTDSMTAGNTLTLGSVSLLGEGDMFFHANSLVAFDLIGNTQNFSLHGSSLRTDVYLTSGTQVDGVTLKPTTGDFTADGGNVYLFAREDADGNLLGQIGGWLIAEKGSSLHLETDNLMASGSKGMAVRGGSTLNFGSSEQTVWGQVSLENGSLIGSAGAALIVPDGEASATFTYAGENNTVQGVEMRTDSAGLTVQASEASANNQLTIAAGSDISGTGSLLFTGSGSVNLEGEQTYSGEVVVENGSNLQLDHHEALRHAASLTIGDNGTLTVTNGGTSNQMTGDLILGDNATVNFTNMSGHGNTPAITLTGGELLFGGDITFSFYETSNAELQNLHTYELIVSNVGINQQANTTPGEIVVYVNNKANTLSNDQYAINFYSDDEGWRHLTFTLLVGKNWQGGSEGYWHEMTEDGSDYLNWTTGARGDRAIFRDQEDITDVLIHFTEPTLAMGLYMDGSTNYTIRGEGTMADGQTEAFQAAGGASFAKNGEGSMTWESITGSLATTEIGLGEFRLTQNSTLTASGSISIADISYVIPDDGSVAYKVDSAALVIDSSSALVCGDASISGSSAGDARLHGVLVDGATASITPYHSGLSGTDTLSCTHSLANAVVEGFALSGVQLSGTGLLTDTRLGAGVSFVKEAQYGLHGTISLGSTVLNEGTLQFHAADVVDDYGDITHSKTVLDIAGLASSLGAQNTFSLFSGEGELKGWDGLSAANFSLSGVNLGTVTNNDATHSAVKVTTAADGSITLTSSGIEFISWDSNWNTSGETTPIIAIALPEGASEFQIISGERIYKYSNRVDGAPSNIHTLNLDDGAGAKDKTLYAVGGTVEVALTKDDAQHIWINTDSSLFSVYYAGANNRNALGFYGNTHLQVQGDLVNAKTIVGGSYASIQYGHSYLTITAGDYTDSETAPTIVAGNYRAASTSNANVKNAHHEGNSYLHIGGGTFDTVYAGSLHTYTVGQTITLVDGGSIATLYGGDYTSKVYSTHSRGDISGSDTPDTDAVRLELKGGTLTHVYAAGGPGNYNSVQGDVTVQLYAGENKQMLTTFTPGGTLYGGADVLTDKSAYSSTLQFVTAGSTYTLSEVSIQQFNTFSLADGVQVDVRADNFNTTNKLVIDGKGTVTVSGDAEHQATQTHEVELTGGATLNLRTSYYQASSAYTDHYTNALPGTTQASDTDRLSYSSIIRVNEGTMLDVSGYPTTGATPELNIALYLAGSGIDGKGALYKASGGSVEGGVSLPSITLTADATIGVGEGGFLGMIAENTQASTWLDLTNGKGFSEDWRGYVLTKTGKGTFTLFNTDVTGGTLNIEQGTLRTAFSSVAGNSDLVLHAGATLLLTEHIGNDPYSGEGEGSSTPSSSNGLGIESLSGMGTVALTGNGLLYINMDQGADGLGYKKFADGFDASGLGTPLNHEGNNYAVFGGAIVDAEDASKTGGGIIKTGGGSQYLTGSSSTYTGDTEVQNGRLYLWGTSTDLDDGGYLKGISIAEKGVIGTGNLIWSSSGTDADGNASNGEVYLGDGVMLINNGFAKGGADVIIGVESEQSGTRTLYHEATYSGVLSAESGSSTLQKVGRGTLTLDQDGTFSGAVNVQEGSLKLYGWANPGDYSSVTVAKEASLLLSYDNSLNGEITAFGAGSSLLINGAGDARWDGSSRTGGETAALISTIAAGKELDVQAAISGSGNVLHAQAGELTLSGANSYTGGTHVTDGTLIVAHNTGLGKTAEGGTANLVAESGTRVEIADAVATTLAATRQGTYAGNNIQGTVAIGSGKKGAGNARLNMEGSGYYARRTELASNATLVFCGVNASNWQQDDAELVGAGRLAGTGGTVVVSDALSQYTQGGSQEGTTVSFEQASSLSSTTEDFTGTLRVEGDLAQLRLANGSLAGTSVEVHGNGATLEASNSDINVGASQRVALSSLGDAHDDAASVAVLAASSVTISDDGILQSAYAKTIYLYNSAELEDSLQFSLSAALNMDESSEISYSFTDEEGEVIHYTGKLSRAYATNVQTAASLYSAAGLTMLPGSIYDVQGSNTSLNHGALLLAATPGNKITLKGTSSSGESIMSYLFKVFGPDATEADALVDSQWVLFTDVGSFEVVTSDTSTVAELDLDTTADASQNYVIRANEVFTTANNRTIPDNVVLVYDGSSQVVYLNRIPVFVPEPTTATLSLLALAALAARRRRK